MNKQEIVNKVLNEIISSELVSCVFTDEVIMDDIDPNINIYCITSNDRFNLLIKHQDEFLDKSNILLYKVYKDNKLSAYYENKTIINIYTSTTFSFNIVGKICPLYDPSNILKSYETNGLSLTNLEYALLFDSYATSLVNFYIACIKQDRMNAYNLSKEVERDFVKIYRAFYDSENAKLEYKKAISTMNNKYYVNLVNIIKKFNYDAFLDGVILSINEIDKIVSVLPINIVTLFNFDFLNYAKQLILNLH